MIYEMVAFNKFLNFVQDVGRKVHNLNSDTLKIMLTNSAPVNTNTVFADLTEISAANGYTAGGTAVGSNAYSHTAGVGKLTGNDVVFTATSTGFGPFRYAVLYNDTSTSDSLIAWWDYGSSISLSNSGETFTVDLDQSAGILTIT